MTIFTCAPPKAGRPPPRDVAGHQPVIQAAHHCVAINAMIRPPGPLLFHSNETSRRRGWRRDRLGPRRSAGDGHPFGGWSGDGLRGARIDGLEVAGNAVSDR